MTSDSNASGNRPEAADAAPSNECPFLILGDKTAAECVANGHCGCGGTGEFLPEPLEQLRQLFDEKEPVVGVPSLLSVGEKS